jgi:hypothetical protein
LDISLTLKSLKPTGFFSRCVSGNYPDAKTYLVLWLISVRWNSWRFRKWVRPVLWAVFSPVTGTRQIANLADIFLLTPLGVAE